MKKKFLTEQDRLKSIQERGKRIVESFKEQFNKIKRLDEVHELDGADINDFTNWFGNKIDVFSEENYSNLYGAYIEDKVIELLYTIGQKSNIDTKIIREVLKEIRNNFLFDKLEERDGDYDNEDIRGNIILFEKPIIKYSSHNDGYAFTAEVVDYNIINEVIMNYINMLTSNNQSITK